MWHRGVRLLTLTLAVIPVEGAITAPQLHHAERNPSNVTKSEYNSDSLLPSEGSARCVHVVQNKHLDRWKRYGSLSADGINGTYHDPLATANREDRGT
jgi:hypothetical protein